MLRFPLHGGSSGFQRERYVCQSVGLPDVYHKGRGRFEAWGWHGSNHKWEPIELGGEIVEF